MKFRVEYSRSFLEDIRNQVGYLREQHVPEETIDRWFGKLLNRIDALEQSPKRHPVDEIQSGAINAPSRKMVHGDYLVFYTVADAEGRVEVDRFVHGARDRSSDRDQELRAAAERIAERQAAAEERDRETGPQRDGEEPER